MRLSQELSSIQIRNIGDQPGTRKFMAEVILVLSTCQCQCPLSSKCLFVSFCALPWLERCDYYLFSLKALLQVWHCSLQHSFRRCTTILFLMILYFTFSLFQGSYQHFMYHRMCSISSSKSREIIHFSSLLG